MVIVVITPCTQSKDDSEPIGDKIVDPSYYLDDDLRNELLKKRNEILPNPKFNKILSDPRSRVGQKETYAFDLYVGADKAITYKEIEGEKYKRLKQKLLKDRDVEWFFLSGGYGIIHALERAKKYDVY